ncbi:MAG: cytochrome c [Candidatus Koribacter versatilis]|uniref:Cytochrome c n=1 Tax=Candidatus Korobacter versatilis TaxID=658062 RepID=A0A932A5P5_9BACT|nr:cytochrome c [Candidatus Koribacter versatilis]
MQRSAVFTALFSLAILSLLAACKAGTPGSLQGGVMKEIKQNVTIGGRDVKNPIPKSAAAIKQGAEHFQRRCQVCHGLDGHNTGVPFANKMDPPVADLGSTDVQGYTDGQLKWIIENGIGPSGMPGWKGILDDDEMWKMVWYIRNLPAAGSLGAPAIFKEQAEEHEGMQMMRKGGAATGEKKPHTHTPGTPPHKD